MKKINEIRVPIFISFGLVLYLIYSLMYNTEIVKDLFYLLIINSIIIFIYLAFRKKIRQILDYEIIIFVYMIVFNICLLLYSLKFKPDKTNTIIFILIINIIGLSVYIILKKRKIKQNK